MESQSVNSAQRAAVAERTQSVKRTELEAEQQGDTVSAAQAEQTRPQPVVNTQGQTIGRLLNVKA